MHVVDVPYASNEEMTSWCKENLCNPISIHIRGGWGGDGWRIYHTTTATMPHYIVTRGEFEDESQAVSFILRWA